MAALNDFVEANIPYELRQGRDYENGRGWVDLTNRLLKKIERNRLFNLSRRIERGVEVENDYWITPPDDMRTVLKIYDPFDPEKFTWDHEILWDKIKLRKSFDKDSDPDETYLSGGTTTTIVLGLINIEDDEYNDYLLILTDGTYSGQGIIISDTTDDDESTILTFRHTQPGTIDSTEGYLTKTYLMLKYRMKFTPMTAYDGEIPIDDDYEDILTPWLIWKVTLPKDKNYRGYMDDFNKEWEELVDEHATPTRDQARVQPIYWPELDLQTTPTHVYTGDE